MKYLMAVVVFGGLMIGVILEVLWAVLIIERGPGLPEVCGAGLTALAIVVFTSLLLEAKRNNWWE